MYSLFSLCSNCEQTANLQRETRLRFEHARDATEAARKTWQQNRPIYLALNARFDARYICVYFLKKAKWKTWICAQLKCERTEWNERARLPPARASERKNIYDSRRRSARIPRFLISARCSGRLADRVRYPGRRSTSKRGNGGFDVSLIARRPKPRTRARGLDFARQTRKTLTIGATNRKSQSSIYVSPVSSMFPRNERARGRDIAK